MAFPFQSPAEPDPAHAARLLKREAARRAALADAPDLPPALDATMARISAEVTAEAVERRDDLMRSKWRSTAR